MKLKAFVGIVLVVVCVVTVTVVWRKSQRTVPTTRPVLTTAKEPQAAAETRPILSNPLKMAAIAAPPKQEESSAPTPPKTGWSDIQVIADTKEDYHNRLSAVKHLPARLTEADWQGARAFLLKQDAQDKEQLGQVLKNELMDALCAMTPPPAKLSEVFIQIYGDLGQNPVIRDYAVQHLATYDEQWGEAGDASTKQAVEKVL